jgi:hypothetical protein
VSDDPYVYPGTSVLRNIDASVAAMQGDEVPMRDLLDEITKPIS